MNPEDGTHSDIIQTKRTFHLYEVSRIVKFVETKNQIVVTRGWGKEEMDTEFNLG